MTSQSENYLLKNLAIDGAIRAATFRFEDQSADWVDPVQFHLELVKRGFLVMSL